MASVKPSTPPAPPCPSCAASLHRCWVCGEVFRCLGCQQCVRCEGLSDKAVTGRAGLPDLSVSVPVVRLKRKTIPARPRPTPPEAERHNTTRANYAPTKRPRVTRVGPARGPSSSELAGVIWHARTAVVPILMLLCGYGVYSVWSPLYGGVVLAAMCVVGFYLPYVVLTPERREGKLFPLGDEGAVLPLGMLIGGIIVGMIAGVTVGIFLGETAGRWGGIAVAMVTFHVLYYAAVAERAAARK